MNKAYRAVVTSNCGGTTTATTAVKTIVVNPLSVAGTVTGGGAICNSGTAGGTLTVTGNTGTIQWQYSIDGTNYINAPKTLSVPLDTPFNTSSTGIASTYIVTNISADVYFRVKVTSGACDAVYSGAVLYYMVPSAVAGTISPVNAVICAASGTTLTLSGSTGAITWSKSTTWTAALPTWTNVTTGISGNTLSTGNLTASTAYRATVSVGGSCPAVVANFVVVTVNLASKGGIVSTVTATTAACAGVVKQLKVATYVGSIQWQSSTNNVIYSDISGATATIYNAVIIVPTYFRVKATNGVCNSAFSNAIQLIISAPAVAGTITASQNPVCSGSTSVLTLNGTTTGTIVWQKSVSPFTTWAAVTTGIVGNQLTTAALTVATAYRVAATSGACVDYSNVMTIGITPKPVAKAITSNNTLGATLTAAICTNATSTSVKTFIVGSGYVGTIQWQVSTTSATLGFADIAGATGTSYTVSNPSIGANYYRAKFSNGSCTDAFSNTITVFYKDCGAAKIETAAPTVAGSRFEVKAYPNPYTETFNLSLSTASEGKIGIVVYDMTGRLLERREVRPSDMVEQQIGDRYPSGVYNVVVTQGEEVKTLRVIKR